MSTYAAGDAVRSTLWQRLGVELDGCGVRGVGGLAAPCVQVPLGPDGHGVQVAAFPLPLLPMEAVQQQPPYGVPLCISQAHRQHSPACLPNGHPRVTMHSVPRILSKWNTRRQQQARVSTSAIGSECKHRVTLFWAARGSLQ